MALALYRKYRPAKFAEVVGQEHVTEPLSTALAAGRINHAYLFSGPRGCGKTSSARILARSLNCELGPTAEPCGVCPSCVSLAPGGPGNIDVTELDAASHGGVDDTRELRDRAFFAPAESRYRVFIVDEAHMITTQGFNALLKIVEEPPEHLVFVFATTEPDKVLPTIRSRTHHYPFRLIPPGTLRKLMERICAEEGAVVAPAVYPLVIRAGGGSARDSLSVLDQLLAGAGPEGVTYERAVALLGVTDVALIDDVVDALAAGDRAAVFEAVDRMVEAGHDPRRFASDLLQRLRDLTLLQAVPEAATRGLVDAADDEIVRMVEQADRIGPATLVRYGEIVHNGLIEMRGATAPRLLLELLCARMLLPAATTAEPGLLERLERLERRNDIAASPLPAAETVAEPASSAAARRTFERPSSRSAVVAYGPTDGRSAEGSDDPARPVRGDAAEPVRSGAGRSARTQPPPAERADAGPDEPVSEPTSHRARTDDPSSSDRGGDADRTQRQTGVARDEAGPAADSRGRDPGADRSDESAHADRVRPGATEARKRAGADSAGADSAGAEPAAAGPATAGADGAAIGRAGAADAASADRAGADAASVGRAGAGAAGADRAGPDAASAGRAGADAAATDPSNADPGGANLTDADPTGAYPNGAGPTGAGSGAAPPAARPARA
ncbi:MAG TPA: DNA polymerase III subunit gamma and tau, partial [Pseudonocardia sp.]|nr:DNA polymerase III subunit gamma and tau [Pseudonocardia sp.]